MSANLSEDDKRVLAECLMKEGEELTPELLEGAIDALRRRHLEQRQRELHRLIEDAERKNDSATLTRLVQEKEEVARALRSTAVV
jgi:hypothetical protein